MYRDNVECQSIPLIIILDCITSSPAWDGVSSPGDDHSVFARKNRVVVTLIHPITQVTHFHRFISTLLTVKTKTI